MIRVSIGTAAVLGLDNIQSSVNPTTGYFMNDGNCQYNCSFCVQGKESKQTGRLSRITWPVYSEKDIQKKVEENKDLKRLCLQVVQCDNWFAELERIVDVLTKEQKTALPLCVSCKPETLTDIKTLFSLGIDRLSIPLDACTPTIAKKINRPWKNNYKLLKEAAVQYKGRLNTHLIIGLGETEKEAVNLMNELYDLGVNIALFAFTPIRGTNLEYKPSPQIGHYRRIQAAHYLITEKNLRSFCFINNSVIITQDMRNVLSPKAFETSGCPDCNRPFYNERPGKTIYNFPRPLSEQEFATCLAQLKE